MAEDKEETHQRSRPEECRHTRTEEKKQRAADPRQQTEDQRPNNKNPEEKSTSKQQTEQQQHCNRRAPSPETDDSYPFQTNTKKIIAAPILSSAHASRPVRRVYLADLYFFSIVEKAKRALLEKKYVKG